MPCCAVLCLAVPCCALLCCAVLCSAVPCCAVPKALLPKGNGRDVYPWVQVNGRAVCLSARCVLVCCCTAGTSAQLHLAGAALPTPVHCHTGSIGPTAPYALRCTISTLCAVLHCLVLCTALHCVCRAALRLWAVGSGSVAMYCLSACGQGAVEVVQLSAALPVGSRQWKSCNAPTHSLGIVDSGTAAMHCHTAWGKWGVELL